jgi:hypothetical protein
LICCAQKKSSKSKKTLADFAGKLEWKGDPGIPKKNDERDEWK